VKNGKMIEQYEVCGSDAKKLSKELCQEMAKINSAKCKCKDQ
jgi:hypothetical protein